ncbi:hypothetical protein C9374_011803 [Naegleria lovaniensis]|uniref:Uncharacterized protein n=1 Tax=Naegleria lovaniensis TaxID=51637 RepID=A0AA88KEI0_NAELO|nr:uncharacterized protein C9374_011803 [Naegleria lovaniensis]KAG2373714.1 hypothetical protein C9374_011803 [Naegleria lovaniensis]
MPSDPSSSSSTTTTTASPIPCPLPPPIEQCKYSFEMDHAMFGTSRDQWTSPSPYRSFYDDPLSSPSSLLGTGQKGEGHSSSSSSVSTTPSVESSWNQNNQGSMNQFPNMGNNGMMMNSGQNSSTIMNTNNNNNNTNGNIASNNTTNYNTKSNDDDDVNL